MIVKFQSWDESSLYAKSFYKENPIAERMFKKLSIGKEEFLTLRDAAKELGISIASTPYSFEEVDFLVDEVKGAIYQGSVNGHRYASISGTYSN